jgi:hypothetical protein
MTRPFEQKMSARFSPSPSKSSPLVTESLEYWNFCALCGVAPQETPLTRESPVMVCMKCKEDHGMDVRGSSKYRKGWAASQDD